MEFLIQSFLEVDGITWLKYLVMWVIGGLLIFLAIKKEMEPALLLPMGFGCILVNIPFSNVLNITDANGEVTPGIFLWLLEMGIHSSVAMPILLPFPILLSEPTRTRRNSSGALFLKIKLWSLHT